MTLAGLRLLHQLATEYPSKTPAEHAGITDPLAALALNRACLWAGTHQKDAPKPLGAIHGRI